MRTEFEHTLCNCVQRVSQPRTIISNNNTLELLLQGVLPPPSPVSAAGVVKIEHGGSAVSSARFCVSVCVSI